MKRVRCDFGSKDSWLADPSGACVIALMMLAPVSALGQSAVWLPQNATTGSIYYTGGNVGIGTSSPSGGLQIANAGLQWSAHNFGSNLILDNAAIARHTAIGLFDASNSNPWAIANISGVLNIAQMPALGKTTVVPTYRVAIDATGNVGIGTTSPAARLHVNGLGAVASSAWNIWTAARFSDGGQNSNTAILFDTGATGTTGLRGLAIGKNSQDLYFGRFDSAAVAAPTYDVSILSNGSVGVGTMNPGAYKLAVEGTIGAREVIVTTSPWADFVFRPSYRLRPLSEISQYIQANGHLPDIPTEAEVKEKGISLGDMQAKLLAKVEELTLHLIQQDKENHELREQMNHQTKENRDLRERLARLEKGATAGAGAAVHK
jgi:hypothetical protein